MRQHVGVTVALEAVLLPQSYPPQNERAICGEAVGVVAKTHAEDGSALRHRLRSARICSAWRRSTLSVTLKFSGEPSTTATRPPRASTREASSVAPRRASSDCAYASISACQRKICGVWARPTYLPSRVLF